MGEQCRQWQKKARNHKWWVGKAIATPLFLWMVWCFGAVPDRRVEAAANRRPLNERATLAHLEREVLISSIGAIAIVAGGVVLLLNGRFVHSNTKAINLSDVDFSRDLCGADLSGVDFNGVEMRGANLREANLSGADLSSTDLSGADLSGANLSDANLSGANLSGANLSGADLSRANLRYADLSRADLRSANLRYADLRTVNLSRADLNCAFLDRANLSDANLSDALILFVNLRDTLNLEPLQLRRKPLPCLCNVALPTYASHPKVDPNRDCDRIPQRLSDRYNITLEEAQGIVREARQHRWN